jgi:hypothetical protein
MILMIQEYACFFVFFLKNKPSIIYFYPVECMVFPVHRVYVSKLIYYYVFNVLVIVHVVNNIGKSKQIKLKKL